MSSLTRRTVAPAALLALVGAWAAPGPLPLPAQAGAEPAPAPAAPERPGEADAPPAGLYVGPATCAQDACHGSTRPRDVFSVDQNEYYAWLNRDRHARAYEVLFDERSRVIARNLGLARPAHEAPACLACHTLAAPEAARSGAIEATDGVSCEACHGPASGWRGGHTAEDWTYERSVAAGMADLRDLAVRGRVCLGCHLGTGGTDAAGAPGGARAVDHDLIAAGHPPLQFELDNFTQTMPVHWRREPVEGVRSWAVGQAAGFRHGLLELARRAGEESWPDLSFLDCGSCHHSLAEERFRRGERAAGEYSARIGMPPWSPARWAVLRVLVARHAPEELPALDEAVRRLARQVSGLSTPAAEVTAGAQALARRVEPLVARLGGVVWTAEEARRTLLALTAEGNALAGADVASAEQAVQALYSLAGYLLEERPRLVTSDVVDGLEALAREVEDPEAFDPPRFRAALARVEEGLR